MGTECNKLLVRAFVEAINQQDWRRFDELVAPDFIRHSSTFGQTQIRTRDQLRDYLANEFRTFPDAVETINFLVTEGDKVAVHSHCHATQRGPMGSLPASGRVLSADFISITAAPFVLIAKGHGRVHYDTRLNRESVLSHEVARKKPQDAHLRSGATGS